MHVKRGIEVCVGKRLRQKLLSGYLISKSVSCSKSAAHHVRTDIDTRDFRQLLNALVKPYVCENPSCEYHGDARGSVSQDKPLDIGGYYIFEVLLDSGRNVLARKSAEFFPEVFHSFGINDSTPKEKKRK